MARRKQEQRKRWEPMRRGVMDPTYFAAAYPDGMHEQLARIEVWANDIYEATVEIAKDGWAYITLKRFDRRAVRDWRHLQSIKNEICGAERTAIEIFPPESQLVDEANQYHLYVLPRGEGLPMAQRPRHVGGTEFTQGRVRGEHRGRQRPWQPGLSTGPDYLEVGDAT